MPNIVVKKGMPRKGWVTVGTIDHGVMDESEYSPIKCSLCGTAIRYEHLIAHSEWPDVVSTGVVCAEELSKDYIWRNKVKWKDKTIQNCNISYTKRNKKISSVCEVNGEFFWLLFDEKDNANYDSRRVGLTYSTFKDAQDGLYQLLENEDWV